MSVTIMERKLLGTLADKRPISVTLELARIGESIPRFSATASINGKSKRHHREILEVFPEVAPVVAMHMRDEYGEPLAAVARGIRMLFEDCTQLVNFWGINKLESETLLTRVLDASIDAGMEANRNNVSAPTRMAMKDEAQRKAVIEYLVPIRVWWRRAADHAKAVLALPDYVDDNYIIGKGIPSEPTSTALTVQEEDAAWMIT